jgi:hypothetical protein
VASVQIVERLHSLLAYGSGVGIGGQGHCRYYKI